MNTTPKCLYCGTTMKPDRTFMSMLPAGERPHFWYLCGECGSRSPAMRTQEDAKAAALQRYVEPLKPMTLDELTTIEEPTPIYVLHRYGEWQQNGWHIWEPRPDDRDCETSDTQNYGITWDAYLRRPTDEERQSVAWEESE